MSEKTKVDPVAAGEAKRKLVEHGRRLPSRVRNRAKKAMKLRRYPLHECLVSDDWREPTDLTSIVVSRKMPGGVLAVAVFLVDMTCLGVKAVIFETSVTRARYAELAEGGGNASQACSPELATRIIDHAVRYALALGFYPDDDYFAAIKLLDGVDPEASDEPIPLGRDGVPFYIAGPHDDVQAVFHTLTERLGPDGFDYFAPIG